MSTVFLCEIPTGSIADYYGRKISVLIGCFFSLIAALVYGMSSSFFGFFVAEILFGFGLTFITGALEAWVVDSTFRERKLKNIKVGEIFGKGQAFENVGMLMGGFLGGLIAAINISYPWFMISLTYFITILFGSILMKERVMGKRVVKGIQKNLNEVLKIAKQSIHYTKTHRTIVYFLFAGAMVSFSFQIILQFWQPYLTSLKLSIETLGYAWVLMMLFLIYGSYFGTKLTKKFKNERPLILMSLVISSLTYLGFALFLDFRIATFSLLLWEFGHGIHTPLVSSFYNEFIPRKQRATMLNFKSMIAKIGQVLSLLLTGYLADTYGLQLPFFLGTLLTFAGLIVYSGIKK